MVSQVLMGLLMAVNGWPPVASGGSPLAVASNDEFEQAPINYSQSTPDNPVSRLQAGLEAGDVQLHYDAERGYLESLLNELDVPVESQMLVFSKTSLQRSRITSRTPRAIYFNDDVYVGFCQSGDVLEISAVDPKLGTVFYTLEQQAPDEEFPQPVLTRQTDNCLICHSSSRTSGVPGHVIRSLFVQPSGQPIFSAGSQTVDDTTPLADRWGGWYVTGTHGTQTHLGNLVVSGSRVQQPVDNEQGHNVTDLSERFDTRAYLTPHSDIVALMVLEHQTHVHNLLTKANFDTRQALHYEQSVTEAMGETDRRLDSTSRRIANAGDELVRAMLLADEARLTDPIEGTSEFAQRFAEQGPRDSRGRSLRQFDLSRRMFKYPCSYLIYSQSFNQLPKEMLDYVWRRLWQILAEDADAEEYSHLTAADKTALIQIIADTKPDRPKFWKIPADTQ